MFPWLIVATTPQVFVAWGIKSNTCGYVKDDPTISQYSYILKGIPMWTGLWLHFKSEFMVRVTGLEPVSR